MKNVFLTLTAACLVACGSNDECCNSDIVLQDTIPTLETDSVRDDIPFDVESTANVSDLLDSLSAVEPAAKMTH